MSSIPSPHRAPPAVGTPPAPSTVPTRPDGLGPRLRTALPAAPGRVPNGADCAGTDGAGANGAGANGAGANGAGAQAPRPREMAAGEWRRCPVCAGPVPERLSPAGGRRRGRPRIFCSDRCRVGDRRSRAAVDPALRREQVTRFAAAVRAAIAASGLSLRQLEKQLLDGYGGLLASSVATLSAWQTGDSSPPRTLTGRNRVLALERCLALPTGELVLLMPGGPVVPAPRPPARVDGLAGRWARLEHLVGAHTGPQQVLPVSLTVDHWFGASRRPLCTRISLTVRAAHDGVDRFWFVDATDTRLEPVVVDSSDCEPGERVPEPPGSPPVPPDLRLVALELRFDRPLARGDWHKFSFIVQYDSEHPLLRTTLPLFRQVATQPCEKIDLRVSFDRRSVPDEVRHVRWRQRDLAEEWSRPSTRPGCRGYQLVVADPAPGGYGWRWVWGPALDRVTGVGRRARGAS